MTYEKAKAKLIKRLDELGVDHPVSKLTIALTDAAKTLPQGEEVLMSDVNAIENMDEQQLETLNALHGVFQNRASMMPQHGEKL